MPYMSTDRNEYQLKMSLTANTFMLYPYTYNIQNVIKKLRRRVSSSSLLVLIISNRNNVWMATFLNWLVNVLVRITHPDPRRGIPPRAAVGRPGGWGGRSGWAVGAGGHGRPLGPVGGLAGGLSGGGADE